MRDTENRNKNSVKCKIDKIQKMTEVKTTKIRKITEKVRNKEQ